MHWKLTALMSLLSFPLLASSGWAEGWTVTRISGKGWIVSETVPAAPASAGTEVPPGFTIATGPNTRAVLVNGGDTMMLGPSTKVAVPYKADSGLATTVFQQMGSLDLSIDKQNAPHFSVQTPYLAAVVKGTEFNVTVDDGDTKVSVTRGVVAVADFKTGERSEVTAGQAASTSRTAGLQVSGAKSKPSVHPGAVQKSQVAPAAGTPATPSDDTASPSSTATPAAASGTPGSGDAATQGASTNTGARAGSPGGQGGPDGLGDQGGKAPGGKGPGGKGPGEKGPGTKSPGGPTGPGVTGPSGPAGPGTTDPGASGPGTTPPDTGSTGVDDKPGKDQTGKPAKDDKGGKDKGGKSAKNSKGDAGDDDGDRDED